MHTQVPIAVYDVVQAVPNHNFLVKTNSGYICSHNCGLLDEVDYVKGASAQMEQSKVMRMYRSVKRRMESRYMRQGELPGILFLVSSKKSEHDFLEQYTKTQSSNPNVLIIDEPLWHVKPASNYSGEVFHVAVGNKFVKSKIINETEDVESYNQQGYRVIDVPVEHRQAFELDIDSALMDIAGISVTSKSKFISYDRLKRNYSDRRLNPFKAEILSIGLDDNQEIKDYFVPELVDEGSRMMPGFIHLDTSLTGDHTGISYVGIEGTKKVSKYNKTDSEGVKIESEIDLVFKQIFTIGIQAPADSEISFEKSRQFIYYLKSIGFNIKGVSADGYQSADTIQLLTVAGYNAKVISLDRTPAGYLAFKSAINEERLNLLKLDGSKVETEIIELERDGITGKIDHPDNGTRGSKDESDSLCGAIYNASMYEMNNRMKHAAEDTELTAELLVEDTKNYNMTNELLGLGNAQVVTSVEDIISAMDDDLVF